MAENITVSELYIDNVKMPDPAIEGFTVTKEKVWSSNTARSSNAKMLGDIIGIKNKIVIRWPPLPPDDIDTIDAVVSNEDRPFVPMRYTDVTGKTVTKTVYFGTPSYDLYSWAPGIQLVTATVDAVEQ